MKVAVIDMGTNTFHLMIAEKHGNSYQVLLRDKVFVQIGKGGINNGLLTEEAMQRAVAAVVQFRQQINKAKVNQVLATATSAIRSANNGDELVKRMEEAAQITPRVISGNEEAELIFEGVKSAVNIGDAPVLVMDIGGGSVEFIIGDKKQIRWKQSFEIGAQRLFDLFHVSDPITPADIARLNDYLQTQLAPLLAAAAQYQPEWVIGSSGSFDTFRDMYTLQQTEALPTDEPNEALLPLAAYQAIYHQLIGLNRAERSQLKGMVAQRVDMIVVAACLFSFVLNQTGITQIKVSNAALKEGLLARVFSAAYRQ